MIVELKQRKTDLEICFHFFQSFGSTVNFSNWLKLTILLQYSKMFSRSINRISGEGCILCLATDDKTKRVKLRLPVFLYGHQGRNGVEKMVRSML